MAVSFVFINLTEKGYG